MIKAIVDVKQMIAMLSGLLEQGYDKVILEEEVNDKGVGFMSICPVTVEEFETFKADKNIELN